MINRNDEYYKQTWEEIIDKDFAKTVFIPYPALVCKKPVNGHRNFLPYYGGQFDQEKYDLIDDMWDHEHCSVCNYKIKEGDTYWFNKGRIRLLCDECYIYYKKS